jgi:hypothetical protein
MIKFNLSSVSAYRKAAVAGIGTVVTLATSASAEFSSFLPEGAAKWVATVVAGLTAVSVFLVKNAEVIDDAGKLG